MQPFLHIIKVCNLPKAFNFNKKCATNKFKMDSQKKNTMFRSQGRTKEDRVLKRLPKGSPGVHEGGSPSQFFDFFELWAVLGPKWFQELSQEPPEPSQAYIFHDYKKKYRFSVFLGHRQSRRPEERNQQKASIPFLCLKCWGSVFRARWRAGWRQVDISISSRMLCCDIKLFQCRITIF